MTNTRQPVLIILAGPNGSGKTTFATQLTRHEWGKDCLVLNADELAEKLGGWNDTACVQKAQLMVREQLSEALNNRMSMIYETVFSHPSKLELVREARAKGYFIRLFFICTESPRINIDRVADRYSKGGHTVPGDKVSNRYTRAMLYGAEALELVQRGYVYDNSKQATQTENSFELLFRTIDGEQLKLYSNPATWAPAYRYFLQDVSGAEYS